MGWFKDSHDTRRTWNASNPDCSHEWCRWVPRLQPSMSGAADFPGLLPSYEEFDSITKRNLVATQDTTEQSRPLPVAQHTHSKRFGSLYSALVAMGQCCAKVIGVPPRTCG